MIAGVVGELLIGWLLADLIGGVIHWFEDRIAQPHWPVIGRHVVQPNRDHHARPQAFTAGDLVTRNGTTWAAVALIALLWLMLFGVSLTFVSAAIGGAMSSQVHYWAHVPKQAPRIVRTLQAIGLFQSSTHHARHHRPDVLANYCVLTDLVNPVLTHLDMWRHLEAIVARLGVPVERAA